MTNYHPLTEKIVGELTGRTYDRHAHNEEIWQELVDSLDATIRAHLTPPPVVAGSGVRFPDMPDTLVSVAGNFITSGSQMQMAIIGTEPILVVQPEYDVDENEVTLITTAVDLPPAGLVHVLEALLDGVREIVRLQEDAFVEHEVKVIQRRNALQAAGPDEFPTGYYDAVARQQLADEA